MAIPIDMFKIMPTLKMNMHGVDLYDLKTEMENNL
jgi:hypothetical protein